MNKKNKIIDFIIKNKKYLICITIIVLSIVSIILQQIDRNNSVVVNSQDIEKREGKIVVYITGEVKSPGVYYLEKEARLYNLIDIAGGLLETADIDKINLAEKLEDSQKIVISAVVERNEDDDESNLEYVDTNESSEKSLDEGKININKATKEQLKTLNGIGDSTADKIINYRNTNKFNSIEEIMNVPGIGNSKFESIKGYICVN